MNWLNNLKIGTRLVLSFMFLILLMGGVGWLGASSMRDIYELLNGIYNNNLKPIIHLSDANSEMIKFGRNHYRVVLSKDKETIDSFIKRIETNHI